MAEMIGTVSAATIANAKTELRNVQSVIEILQPSLDQTDGQPVLSGIVPKGTLEAPLEACRDACNRFHEELKNLLRHSSEGELSRRDRFKVGFLAKDRVVAFISELNVCKLTISLALNGTNLMVSMEQYMRLRVLANQRSTGIPSRSTDIVDQDLAADIERGAQLAKGYQDLLAFFQAKVEKNRRQIEVGNVEMLNSARVMAGVNNTGGTEGDISVKVGNVKADGGKALLGYTSKVDVDAFFR